MFENNIKTPYYVITKDIFMSNWGLCEGKDNICVIPCKNFNIAKKVMQYAKKRGDQENIHICCGSIPEINNAIYTYIPSWVEKACNS